MQFFKHTAEIVVHRVYAQSHVLCGSFFGHAVRDATQNFGFLLGKLDVLALVRELLEGFENHSGNLRIKRHTAFRHIIEGSQDFQRSSGFDEITMGTCLERGEHLFTIMEGGENEYPGMRKFFPDQSDPFQSTHPRQAKIQQHEIGLESIREFMECLVRIFPCEV